MVLLGIPPLASRNDLGRNRLLVPLLANLIRNFLRNLLLLLAMREDHATVLCTDITALAIQRCRIVHTIEELEELTVAHDGGIKGNLESFGVCRENEKGELRILTQVTASTPSSTGELRSKHLRPVSPLHTAR